MLTLTRRNHAGRQLRDKDENDEIRSRFDLRTMATERGVQFRSRSSAPEQYGPCPLCSGGKRFHATERWFFCRHCHPQRGDVFDFIMWYEGVDFTTAKQRLGGNRSSSPSTRRMTQLTASPDTVPQARREAWNGETRREEAALYEAATARERLTSSDGWAGRDYLNRRNIIEEVAAAWGIGYNPRAWHPTRKKPEPALTFPFWQNGKLVAVRYRFVGADIAADERFGYRKYSLVTLFGLQLLDPSTTPTLFICEGELNAISISQVARFRGVDVLSIGSQSTVSRFASELSSIAENYRDVFVWLDEEEKAGEMALALDWRVTAIQSPKMPDAPKGLDASDMLQLGFLTDFIQVKRKRARLAQ